MDTPEKILEPYIESFTGNGDYYFQYVSVSQSLSAMEEYGDKREEIGYKKGYEEAMSEAIKEVHKNYRPNE